MKALIGYLTVRRQCLKADNGKSNWKLLNRGVLQGAVIGPLLFLLYIKDNTTVITFCKCYLYADDLQIYSHFPLKYLPITVTNINCDI